VIPHGSYPVLSTEKISSNLFGFFFNIMADRKLHPIKNPSKFLDAILGLQLWTELTIVALQQTAY
jgi:hypothetical protein